MWSQFTNVTDRQTDRQTTCDRNTALCTKVHRAVIKLKLDFEISLLFFFDQKLQRMENMWDNSISSARYFMARYIFWSFSPNDSIYLQPCPINVWCVTLKYALMLTWKFWCLSNRNVISATFWKLFSVIVTTQILKRAGVKCESMWNNVKQTEKACEHVATRRPSFTSRGQRFPVLSVLRWLCTMHAMHALSPMAGLSSRP